MSQQYFARPKRIAIILAVVKLSYLIALLENCDLIISLKCTYTQTG